MFYDGWGFRSRFKENRAKLATKRLAATKMIVQKAMVQKAMVQKAAILPLTVGLTAGLAACQQAPEQAITSTSAAPTVLNTAEVYNPNELTIIAPANTLEGNSTLIQVAENSTEVIRVRAQDVPNARLSYRLQDGADMDKFIIDEKTGDLSFKEMPDWESPTDENQDNNYMVLWQVVSSSGSARSQFMIVKVTDLED